MALCRLLSSMRLQLVLNLHPQHFSMVLRFHSPNLIATLISTFVFSAVLFLSSGPTSAQQPVVVQPGAPGQPTKTLSSSTRAKLPPTSRKDVEFMQGMIMHHEQAVEMVDLIESRTQNKNLRLLGARIANSQLDEIKFMKRWLEMRGESIEHKMPPMDSSSGHSHGASGHEMLMPGMLSKKQMDALRNAKEAEFDKLFLKGMIQHHKGALVMVEDMFGSSGSGQDAELFSFATDVDSGQRAEIATMETLLRQKP